MSLKKYNELNDRSRQIAKFLQVLDDQIDQAWHIKSTIMNIDDWREKHLDYIAMVNEGLDECIKKRSELFDEQEEIQITLYDVDDGIYWGLRSKIKESQKKKEVRKVHDYSAEPIHCYMVTFTLKPQAKHRWGAAEKMIRNIPRREKIGFEILEMRMTRETTKAGVKHWHVGLKVRGIVKKDRFLGYTQSFGLVKVDRQWTSDSLDGPMSKYCSKENPFEIIFPEVPDKSLS